MTAKLRGSNRPAMSVFCYWNRISANKIKHFNPVSREQRVQHYCRRQNDSCRCMFLSLFPLLLHFPLYCDIFLSSRYNSVVLWKHFLRHISIKDERTRTSAAKRFSLQLNSFHCSLFQSSSKNWSSVDKCPELLALNKH